MTFRLTCGAAIAAVVTGHCARGQCAGGWEAVGEIPGTWRPPISTAWWDADGDGPAPAWLFALGAEFAGRVRSDGPLCWDGTAWRALGSERMNWVATGVGPFLYAMGGNSTALRRWDEAQGIWESLAGVPREVWAMVELPDGDVIIGGGFADFAGHRSLVSWDAQSERFEGTGIVDGDVYSLLLAGERLYASGMFSTINGAECAGFAAMDVGTRTWQPITHPTGQTTPVGRVLHVAEEGETLYATFSDWSLYHRGLEGDWRRLNRTGTGRQLFRGVARAANGDLVGIGAFNSYGGSMMYGPIARYTAADDWSFPLQSRSPVGTAQTLQNGRVLLGAPYTIGVLAGPFGDELVQGNGMASWSPVDARVSALGNGLSSAPRTMLPLDDGSVLLAGSFPSAGNAHTGAVVRWNPLTREYSDVGAQVLVNVGDLIRLRNGEILAGGLLRAGGAGVLRWNRAGNSWEQVVQPWSTSAGETLFNIRLAETADGRLVAWTMTGLYWLLPGETQWRRGPVFGMPASGGAMLVDGDSSVLLGGVAVRRWNIGETTVTPLGSGAPSTVSVLIRGAGGELIAAGSTCRRLDPATRQWLPLAGGDAFGVAAATPLPNGDVVFCCASGTAAPHSAVVKWSEGTGTWSRLTSLEGLMATTSTLLSERDLLIGGDFYRLDYVLYSPRLALYRNVVPPCVTDFDCSRSVDSDDVIGFFAAWEAGESRADLDGDGAVDGEDVVSFFRSWDAGC